MSKIPIDQAIDIFYKHENNIYYFLKYIIDF